MSSPAAARSHPYEPFTRLGVDRKLAAVLSKDGIVSPRPIQTDTIAAGLAGQDVCGRAPTGSGKTLAFALPLAHLDRGDGRPVGLVLAPTRELALQIAEVVQPLAAVRRLTVRTLIGGTSIRKDLNALDRGVDLVIGCPGRMVDLNNRGELDLSQVSLAVLDEADRMADMGFIPDVTRLLDATDCRNGQLLLFSATLDATTAKLEKRYQTEPVRVDVGSPQAQTGDVTHTWHVIDRQHRRSTTEMVLNDHGSAIVFTRTKRGADRLARQLGKGGHPSAAIHGDRSQSQRQRALAKFVDGSVRVLVATDIAARGIHVDDVDVVIHYDLPATAEDYTHRSGRTGRAGADGTVVAMVPKDAKGDADTLARGLTLRPDITGTFGGSGTTPNGNGAKPGGRPAHKKANGRNKRSGKGGGARGGSNNNRRRRSQG